jgi:hypothetical protein
MLETFMQRHRFFDVVAGGDDEEYGERWRVLVGEVGLVARGYGH